MSKFSVLGIDPSLRNTGFAVVNYDPTKENQFWVSDCHIITNPQSFKGTDAILNMLENIKSVSELEVYKNVSQVIIESPAALFNAKFPAGALISIGHISGGAACLFGIDKSFLVRPVEWNKARKKEKTREQIEKTLGSHESWHYTKKVKSEKHFEHIIDGAGMALWWIQNFYIDLDDAQD